MTEDRPQPEVIAVRYATMQTARASQYYRYSAYDQPDEPMSLDYYFWVVRRPDDIMLVDCGFHPDAGLRRPGRVVDITPVEALRSIGIDRDQVSRVVVSHFHYDHIGNLAAFPEARVTVQRAELDFWTGPLASRPAVSAGVEAAEIAFIADSVARGRVDVVTGDATIDDDISVSLVGGHCPGQQVVTVRAERPVVLCSDAVHFYDEIDHRMPHHGVFDLQQMYQAYDRLDDFRSSGAVVVPGHDAAVMSRFEPLAGHAGLAVRLA